MEEVEEMPRPNLVDRGEEQVLLTRDECVLRRLVPRRIGRRDIIDRRQAFLIRPRNIDIGAVLPIIGRRFLDLRLFGAGNAHDILLDQKGDRKSVVWGKGWSVRGDLGGSRIIK